MKKNVFEILKTLVLLGIIVVGVGMVHAWTGPSVAPPNGNVAAPLNVSNVTQEKAGILGSYGFYSFGTGFFSTSTNRANWPPVFPNNTPKLTFAVNGSVGAMAYCDDNGNNCKTITELASSAPAAAPVILGGGSTFIEYWAGTTHYRTYGVWGAGVANVTSNSASISCSSGVKILTGHMQGLQPNNSSAVAYGNNYLCINSSAVSGYNASQQADWRVLEWGPNGTLNQANY